MGINGSDVPRDIDLCYVGDRDLEDRDLSYKLAQEYCPEDLAHGYGIENLEEDYFQTRDFTINEVLVHGNEIYLTKSCLLDTVRSIIRFSDYEKINYYDENQKGAQFVNDKLASKALRFIAEKRNYRNIDFADEDFFENRYISDFHMALHLDRALGISYDIACSFVEELKQRNQIPKEVETPSQCLEYLKQYTDFIFRFEDMLPMYDYMFDESIEIDSLDRNSDETYEDIMHDPDRDIYEKELLISEYLLEKYERQIKKVQK